MDIGDKVQHFSTGSIGTIIDSSYEVETPFQQMCVVWEDDKAPLQGFVGKARSPLYHSAHPLRF